VPGGTNRNRDSYGHKIAALTEEQWAILADPQTSGGLLIAVNKNGVDNLIEILNENGLGAFTKPIGHMVSKTENVVTVL
jgi:selenide,water dikinase